MAKSETDVGFPHGQRGPTPGKIHGAWPWVLLQRTQCNNNFKSKPVLKTMVKKRMAVLMSRINGLVIRKKLHLTLMTARFRLILDLRLWRKIGFRRCPITTLPQEPMMYNFYYTINERINWILNIVWKKIWNWI